MEIKKEFLYENDKKKYAIIKISDKSALKSMQKGEIWLRHPAYYQKEFYEKGDTVVGDYLDSIWYKHIVSDNIFGGNTIVDLYQSDDSCRIICFYMIELDNEGRFPMPNVKIRDFGECFSFVNINKMFSILKQKYENTNPENKMEYCHVKMSKIKYLPYDISGEVDNYSKRDDYGYQNELRISLNSLKNVREVLENDLLKQKNAMLLSLLKEQESLANQYRQDKTQELFFKTIGKNKEYEECYKDYIKTKALIKTKEKGFNSCFEGLYLIEELYSPDAIITFS